MLLETDRSSESKAAVDRRRNPRYRFSSPITVHPQGGAQIPAMTIEISVSGLSAVLSSAINIGDMVDLHPVTGDTITAQARHKVGKIYGFEFLGLTQKQSERIEIQCRRLPRYVRNHLGI